MVRTSKSATASKTASSSTKTPKSAAKKVEDVPPPAPVVEETAPVQVDSAEVINVKLAEFSAKLMQMMQLHTTLKQDFKTLSRSVEREIKAAQKASAKKRRTSGNRQPSGFIKPTLITDELASFLGRASGTEMARTEVSKEINQYIRSKKLQDVNNGRIIRPDPALKKLLRVGEGEELTYFNLQRYMKHHFVKADASAAPASTA
jgi:chromatin remodeling complex protein RSC6